MKNGGMNAERAEGFVKLPRSVIDRMAAAPLSAAAWRVLLFLMRELLRHGGKDNGQLKAPHRQLVAFGISASLVRSAIEELEVAGLVPERQGGEPVRVGVVIALERIQEGEGATVCQHKWRQICAVMWSKTATGSGGR